MFCEQVFHHHMLYAGFVSTNTKYFFVEKKSSVARKLTANNEQCTATHSSHFRQHYFILKASLTSAVTLELGEGSNDQVRVFCSRLEWLRFSKFAKVRNKIGAKGLQKQWTVFLNIYRTVYQN